MQIQSLVKAVVNESREYVEGLEELPAIDLSAAKGRLKGGRNFLSNPFFWMAVTGVGALALMRAKR